MYYIHTHICNIQHTQTHTHIRTPWWNYTWTMEFDVVFFFLYFVVNNSLLRACSPGECWFPSFLSFLAHQLSLSWVRFILPSLLENTVFFPAWILSYYLWSPLFPYLEQSSLFRWKSTLYLEYLFTSVLFCFVFPATS